MIRILLADDHTLFRQGLRRLLEACPDLQLAGEAATARDTLERLEREDWDLLLLDLSLPDRSGLDLLRQLRGHLPCPVLVLTMHAAERYAELSVQLGANGYLGKDCTSGELVEAIRKVAGGGHYLPAQLAERLFFKATRRKPDGTGAQLSPREREVLAYLARGYGLVEIGRLLGVKPKTVSTYRARLLAKLGLANNAELVRYALDHDLL